ncbi:hypothetical protein [Acinetobacter haemolyticus]|uniref:hypothetical protein n=1 Tax=Acinetobacter haemolyticus TaxID=29430 RepID=UPI0021CDA1C6|nr:hypothetical protein [Acinetobacter haemolyticus]MCU4378845.1 hypothetical protein [Acinetobacter haemolyticus]
MSGTDILSRIQILLDANTANFEQKMNEAKDTSVSTFDKIKSSAKVMGVAVAAGAASAAVALSAMAWETANHAVELEKYALRANTTTQDFQKMAVGAQAYGVEQEKLSDMMKDFNEKLGELTTIGAGGGVDFFEQIAVKTEGSAAAAEKLILKMQKLSGPEALQLYVDKLEEAGVTQQQMSFYLESMASDMTDLIPLLVNGGEGMKLYSDAAERAGLVMSDETIAQAKILKEQMYLLDLQMQGAKNQLMQAVIPAFVDIAQAFFSGTEQGLQFTDVANGIADGLRFVAKVAIGAATAVQLVGKTIGGLAAAGAALASGDLSGAKSIGSAMLDDLSATALSAAERMDQVTKSTASTTAKQMAALRTVQQTTTGVNKGLGELTKKQNEAAGATKKHSKEADKLWRDLERLHEQQARDREQIAKSYASDFQNMVWDEAEELERIRKAGFSSAEQEKYLALAKQRFDAESAEYFKNLNLELNQYKWTEEKKLQYAYEMDREIAANDVKIADEVRQAKLRFIDQQYAYELNKINESKRERVNSAMAAWGGTYSDMTGQGEDHALSQKRFSRIDESQELFDAQMDLADTAEEREAIWEAHHNRMQFIEQEYFRARANMQLQWGISYVQGAAGVMAQVFGENSKAYQAMFAVQKAMAIAQVMMNAPATFSAVMTSASAIPMVGPFIAPALAAGAVALQMAQAAAIGSVSFQPVGMAHDGIDRVPEEGSWWLDKGERVLKEQTSSKLDSTLDEIRRTNREPAFDMPPIQQPVYNIQALDGKSVERVLKKHSRYVAGSMKGYARNFGR